MATAERLRQKLEALGTETGLPAPITLSAGVACYPEHGATLDEVIQRADRALYYAKNHGRNAVCVADNQARDGARMALPR